MSKRDDRRYETAIEGDWDNWGWRDNIEQCCDCSLTHRVNYRIIEGNQLQRQVFVDRPRTYQARRRAGIKIERTK